MQYGSIHRTLLAEPDSVTLLPGHVTVTSEGEFKGGRPVEPIRATVGELRTGLDVLDIDEEAFVERSLETLPEKPPNYERVIDVNGERKRSRMRRRPNSNSGRTTVAPSRAPRAG